MDKIRTVGSGSFEGAIKRAPREVQEIARALRRLVAGVMPDVVEVPWETQGNVGYGVGPKKMSEQFVYIMPATGHCNLGFYYGADLEDPAGLLEGSGKSLRHVKVRSLANAKSPALKTLVEQARGHLPRLTK
jgi:hypothetical protein